MSFASPHQRCILNAAALALFYVNLSLVTGIQYIGLDSFNGASLELCTEIGWRGGGNLLELCCGYGKCATAVDPRILRPSKVEISLGDLSNAKKKLDGISRITYMDLVLQWCLKTSIQQSMTDCQSITNTARWVAAND